MHSLKAVEGDIEHVQVHLSPAGTNSLNVMWTTGSYKVMLLMLSWLFSIFSSFHVASDLVTMALSILIVLICMASLKSLHCPSDNVHASTQY